MPGVVTDNCNICTLEAKAQFLDQPGLSSEFQGSLGYRMSSYLKTYFVNTSGSYVCTEIKSEKNHLVLNRGCCRLPAIPTYAHQRLLLTSLVLPHPRGTTLPAGCGEPNSGLGSPGQQACQDQFSTPKALPFSITQQQNGLPRASQVTF